MSAGDAGVSSSRFCGIDIGISTTDAVAGWAEERPLSLPTGDPEATAERAIHELLAAVPPPDDRPITIAATGFGSHRIGGELCGLRVRKIPEISAIGRGGTRCAGFADALVVSLGTGTAMVSVRGAEMRHVSPGSGVGGGTLGGFARWLLGHDDLAGLAELALRGDRSRVDLTIGEVVGGPLGGLPAEATASNLGKRSVEVAREDLAAGLANIVSEVVLTVVLLGLQASGHERAILIGKLLLFEPIGRRIGEVAKMLAPLFVIPENGPVATALGALWAAEAGEST
ncbi:MAG: Fumble domain-containing protein [Candidatus Binatia bacterium]